MKPENSVHSRYVEYLEKYQAIFRRWSEQRQDGLFGAPDIDCTIIREKAADYVMTDIPTMEQESETLQRLEATWLVCEQFFKLTRSCCFV